MIMLGITLSYGQNTSRTLNTIPSEKIFVHQNSASLISGEYIYYKLYCINTKTNTLSDISKVAYLKIINSNKNIVLEQKISLSKGQGQGDIFIPTSIPSGNYKLIAYTQWMVNNKEGNYFQNDITIINPYIGNQHLRDTEEDNTVLTNTPSNVNKTNLELNISLNSSSYSTREKVSVVINSLKKDYQEGNYSISVKSTESISNPIKKTSKTYNALFKNTEQISLLSSNDSIYLPEMRGELLQGKITSSDLNLPLSDINVALSILGDQRLFKIATTNESGMFYFNINKTYNHNEAFIQVFDKNKESYKISIQNPPSINFDDLIFPKFKISSKTRNKILQKSIHNQIENAYYKVKPDSVKSIEPINLFPEKKMQTYFLDEYTRFPTLKETIIEIIPEIVFKKTKEHSFFKIRLNSKYNISPLVLLDGILIQNHEEIINYDSNKISEISYLKDEYIYGSRRFNGVIVIKTIDHVFKYREQGDYMKVIKLSKPQSIKKYFNQIYQAGNKYNRIPDYRSQLSWNPDVKLSNQKTIFTFYTSDVQGDFEISLEGFSKSGKAVSLKKMITVKD